MRIVTFLAALGIGWFIFPAQAVVITDGEFAAWIFGSSGAATATVTREASGGNPGARLNITTVTTPTTTAFGTAIKPDFSTTAPLTGAAFTLSLQVLSGAGGFGQGQAIQLLVEQSGTVYGTSLGITGFPRNFDTVTFSGIFSEGSFTRLSGAGPTTPVFNGTVATRFGFAGGNLNSATLTQYYDNFLLDVPVIPASTPAASQVVPTLSEWTLAILAMLVAAVAVLHGRQRRRL